MTVAEAFTEPLIDGDVIPPSITATVFTVTENVPVTRPLSDGHGSNPVSHDPEEKGTSLRLWAEVREQCWLAGPIMCMYLLLYITTFAGDMFVGHLGPFYLAAVSLANSFTTMTGFTVLAGMATAMETLCGQAYGAKQYHLLGVFLQRAIVILSAMGVPMAILWLNMERILVAMGQDPAIAEAAQSYAYWMIPMIVSYAIYFPLVKFFQTQRAVFQVMVCAAGTVLFHVPLCWLVIDKLRVGYTGAAIAFNCSLAFNLLLLFSFIRFSPKFAKTFPSFTWDAFQDVGEFFRIAIPSATMVCFEHWAIELLTLLAGLLPNSKLNISSFAICSGLLALPDMIALALGIATSVRVSNMLGTGNANAARSVLAVSVGIGVIYGTVMGSLLYCLRNVLGWAYSSDTEVVQHVAQTAPYLAVLALLYATGSILSGVVRGIGWQRAGTVANLVAYYVVGLPVAFISVFVFHIEAKGLWLALGCGMLTQILALISILLCADWDQLAQEALLRSFSFSSKLSTPGLPLTKPLLEEDEDPPSMLS